MAGAALSLGCLVAFALQSFGPARREDERPPATSAAITSDEAIQAEGFRSTDADASYLHFPFDKDWSRRPPREVWRIPVGPAWSSFAAADGRVFTQEQRGEKEAVVCYELATGREIWVHDDAACFRDQEGGAATVRAQHRRLRAMRSTLLERAGC